MPSLRLVLALALSLGITAPAAARVPPPQEILLIMEDGSGGCFFYGDAKLVKLGRGITLANSDAVAHDVEQTERFWAFTVPGDESRSAVVRAAGTYAMLCDGDHPRLLSAKVTAPRRPSGADFEVAWADARAGAAWTYDVQFRIGTGTWTRWQQATSLRAATFDGDAGQTYGFRARATRVGGTTGWSPVRWVDT